MSAEQAEELTQAFFTEVVLGRELLNKAEPQKGRLRSLILTALKRFRIDRARRTDAADRALAGRGELASAADSPADSECIGETVFNRLWAAAQIGETLRRCEEHFNRTERSHYWSLFDERVIRPNVGHTEPSPLNTTFARLGFESPAAAAAALQVVKRRFQTVLREVVSEANLDDPDAECDLLSRLA